MTTLTATPTKTRTLRLTSTAGGPALVIREQTGSGPVKVEAYYLTPVPGGIRFAKSDGTVYTVTGPGDSCDCPARHHGPKVVCRHRAALRKLIVEGKLPAPTAAPPIPPCPLCHGTGCPDFGDLDSDGLCRGCGGSGEESLS